jgi:hypothetical protein
MTCEVYSIWYQCVSRRRTIPFGNNMIFFLFLRFCINNYRREKLQNFTSTFKRKGYSHLKRRHLNLLVPFLTAISNGYRLFIW